MLVRKNIYIDDTLWLKLEYLKNQKKKSISKIINDAVNIFLTEETSANLGLILKLNSKTASEKESTEINKMLSLLSKEDLEIGETTKL